MMASEECECGLNISGLCQYCLKQEERKFTAEETIKIYGDGYNQALKDVIKKLDTPDTMTPDVRIRIEELKKSEGEE